MRSRGEGVSNQRGLRRSGRSHGDDGACAGIIAGGTTMSSVKNCRAVDGSITAEGNATWGFGALCGAPWGAPEITDCEAVGTKITVSGEGNRLVGGLVGFGGSYDETAPMQSLLIVMEAWRLVRKQLRLHEGLGHFIMHEQSARKHRE